MHQPRDEQQTPPSAPEGQLLPTGPHRLHPCSLWCPLPAVSVANSAGPSPEQPPPELILRGSATCKDVPAENSVPMMQKLLLMVHLLPMLFVSWDLQDVTAHPRSLPVVLTAGPESSEVGQTMHLGRCQDSVVLASREVLPELAAIALAAPLLMRQPIVGSKWWQRPRLDCMATLPKAPGAQCRDQRLDAACPGMPPRCYLAG